MASVFEKLFQNKTESDEFTDDYVEISSRPVDTSGKAKVMVRPFVIEDFADIKPALDALREGYTVALINIKPLKEKDLVDLKRAIGKLKKTIEAIDGDIAGVGEDTIIASPAFARIYRGIEEGPAQ